MRREIREKKAEIYQLPRRDVEKAMKLVEQEANLLDIIILIISAQRKIFV